MSDKKKSVSSDTDIDDHLDHRAKRARFAHSDGSSSKPRGEETSLTHRSPTNSLAELLNLDSASCDSTISDRFASTSPHSGTLEYEFLEVEFYLRKEGVHEDPFTHGSKEQSSSGKWYFHRAPRKSNDPSKSLTSASGYRGGTRKGLDLTMGGPLSSPHFAGSIQANGPRGGVLLRTIRRISDGVVISGPSLLVDEILRVCGAKNIAELVDLKLAHDTSAFPTPTSASLGSKLWSILVKPRHHPLSKKPIVYSSPRIGLDISHPGTTLSASDPRVVFVQKLYRYFTNPTLLTANGRSQTFFGIYKLIAESGILNEEGVLNEVSRLTGLKRTAVDKYTADFKLGRDKGQLKSFVGPAGKGACSSPSTYLKMMGTLSRLTSREPET